MIPSPASKQRGAALLIMMLVVLVAATAILVTRLNRNDARTGRLTDTQQVLAKARSALIDYAAVYPDLNPGRAARLPCPDIDDSGSFAEGEAHTANCGPPGTTVMGRLPWRTLGTPAFRDSADACLWYVVSGTHKEAGAASSAMLNADTNGQLQLYGIEAGAVIAGVQPQDRPVAMIVAPMPGLNGQSRAAATGAGRACSMSVNAADFLDTDAVSGISNTSLSGVADAIDALALASGYRESHNDRIAIITRADLAGLVSERHDFASRMRALGLAVADCVADYGRNNPGGSNDRRLPWPAPLAMADYRPDAAYDDADAGMISGRLPDVVDDSNAATGNGIGQALTACDPLAVPAWTPQMFSLWQNWKDHFLYAVAESHTPAAAVPSVCSACLTVNGAGQYAAIVLFANSRLPALGQVRNAPPTDVDTKSDPANYADGVNAALFPVASSPVDFASQPAGASFNDLLFCIDQNLTVAEC